MKKLLPVLLAVGIAACQTDQTATPETNADSLGADGANVQPASYTATLESRSGSSVTGEVTFTQEPGGVRVVARVNGLTAGQDHGFHVHETGDCSAPDASSAGDHFAGADSTHGGPDAAQRHDGDLGNLTVGADGVATYDRLDTRMSLMGVNSIVGKAVVVHAGADDLTTQPSGNSGARVACGVISGSAGAAGMDAGAMNHGGMDHGTAADSARSM